MSKPKRHIVEIFGPTGTDGSFLSYRVGEELGPHRSLPEAVKVTRITSNKDAPGFHVWCSFKKNPVRKPFIHLRISKYHVEGVIYNTPKRKDDEVIS